MGVGKGVRDHHVRTTKEGNMCLRDLLVRLENGEPLDRLKAEVKATGNLGAAMRDVAPKTEEWIINPNHTHWV